MKSTTLGRGDQAPAFELPDVDGHPRGLVAQAGQTVLLVFYRGHW